MVSLPNSVLGFLFLLPILYISRIHKPGDSSYYQTRFLCLLCSKPKAETPRSAAKMFIDEAAKSGDRRTNLKSTPQRWGAWDIYGVKLGEYGEMWLKIRKRWGNRPSAQAQLSYRLLHGTHFQKIVALACSEGGVFGLLMSRGHWMDIRAWPVGGLVVPTSLNWPELELDTADFKFLKNNLGKYFIV